MARLKLIVALLAIATFATVALLQFQKRIRLKDENESLHGQLDELGQLRAENERLSNTIARANASLSAEQLSELLRLRGEVTALRQQTNKLEALRRENERLSASLKDTQTKPATRSPPDAPPEDIHPIASWSFAGYDTPDAALQSQMWAGSQTNVALVLAGLTPEVRQKLEKKIAEASPDKVRTDWGPKVISYRVLDRKVISDSEVSYRVFIEEENDPKPWDSEYDMPFKKIDGQWKLNDD